MTTEAVIRQSTVLDKPAFLLSVFCPTYPDSVSGAAKPRAKSCGIDIAPDFRFLQYNLRLFG